MAGAIRRPARPRLAMAWALLAAGAGGACTRARLPAPAPGGAALEVDFAGCAAVRRGPICVLADGRLLRWWIRRPAPRPGGAADIDQAPSPWATTDRGPAALVPGAADDEGVAYQLAVPAGASWVTVERNVPGGAGRFRLALAEPTRDPELDAADHLRREDPAAADARLADLEASEPDPDRRARVGALRARIALGRGSTGVAVAGLRRAFEAASLAGRSSDAAHDGFALAHALITVQLQLVPGRRLLAEIEPLVRDFPEGRPELDYYLGLLGSQSGDLRAALAAFRRAARGAARLGLRALEGYARTQLGVTLAALGRTDQALALGQQVVREAAARGPDPGELPCNRAAPYVDLAWIALLAWRGRGRGLDGDAGDHPDPGPLLADARRALRREGCQDRLGWRNTVLNEALLAISAGDAATARARLAELDGAPAATPAAPAASSSSSPYLAVWEAEARGRLALVEGRFQAALDAFAREGALARAAGFTDGVLRAETGGGSALLRLGRRALAAQRLQVARAAFEEMFRSVPLGEGRDSFLQSNQESARFLIDALARLGRAREAFVVARLDRARALAAVAHAQRLAALSPEQRARWDQALAEYRAGRAAQEQDAGRDVELPRDQLERARARRAEREQVVRARLDDAYQILHGRDAGAAAAPAVPGPAAALAWPRPGELYLGYAAVDGGWLALAATASGVRSVRLPDFVDAGAAAEQTPALVARRWLAPFAAELARASRVLFFPHPALGNLDLHGAPLPDGRPLGEVTAVEYGVDLPSAPPVVVDRGAAGAAVLIVDDPTQDLPATRAETRAVAGALAGAARVQRLEGGQATRDQVVAALARASLFHFAGHAWYAGVDGLDSALPLAGGGRLTAGDVLALPRVPAIVTLAACEAAGQGGDRRAAIVPLGVAEAFLAAGAAAVVAPARAVGDQLASAYMSELYRALAGREYWSDPPFSLAGAAGVAEEKIRRTMPTADWSAFRVLSVPRR